MLLAASHLAPASTYLDNEVMNPSMAKLGLMVTFCFLVLAGMVAVPYFWIRSETLGVIAGVWWVILTTSGRLLSRFHNELVRYCLLSVLLILTAVAARAFRKQILTWVVLASVMSLVATAAQLGFHLLTGPRSGSEWPMVGRTTGGSTGSFYLIVLDGYGAPTERMEDLVELQGALAAHDFEIVTDALSNYTYTHASIANMLSLEHRFKHGSVSVATMFDALQGANQMRSVFERAGFRYIHVESGWSGSRCGSTVTNCVDGSLGDDFVWQVGQLSFLSRTIESHVTHPHVNGGLHSLNAIMRHASTADSGHDFLFAHIVLPHPPLQLEADCEIVIDPRLGGQLLGVLGMNAETTAFRKAGYLDQRACLNSKLISVISSLPEDASVVITADHGTDLRGQLEKVPQEWDQLDIEERFPIFHAVRLPNGCHVGIGHDLVNLVRSEVACIAGISLPPVPAYFEITPYFTTEFEVRVLEATEVPS